MWCRSSPPGRLTLLLALAVLVTFAPPFFMKTRQRTGTGKDSGLILPYDGSLADDPSYRRLSRRLPRMLAGAERVVEERLGVVDCGAVRVRLLDPGVGLARGTFAARTVQGSELRPSIIELDLGTLLSGGVDPDQVLVHELVHVCVARTVGASYAQLPAWLREGIAVRVARQDTWKLDRIISSNPSQSTADLVRPLAVRRHVSRDYAMDGLAVEKIESLAGKHGLVRLCHCLGRRNSWPACRHELTGLGKDEFAAMIVEHARRRFEERAGDRPTEFARGLHWLDSDQPRKALTAFDNLIALGQGPFDREALFQSARCMVAMERFRAAVERLEALKALGALGIELARAEMEIEVEVARRMGDREGLTRVCGAFRRYHRAWQSPPACGESLGV